MDRSLDAVIYFDVSEDELVRRLSGRRVCARCGATYNVHTDPPSEPDICDECGGPLETREDDREETVRVRLRVYRENTEPLLEWYRDAGVPLRTVDGTGPVDEVHSRVMDALEPS